MFSNGILLFSFNFKLLFSPEWRTENESISGPFKSPNAVVVAFITVVFHRSGRFWHCLFLKHNIYKICYNCAFFSVRNTSIEKKNQLIITFRVLSQGHAFNDQDRCVCAGYDNGDIKLFDLRNMSLRWETNIKNGVSVPRHI